MVSCWKNKTRISRRLHCRASEVMCSASFPAVLWCLMHTKKLQKSKQYNGWFEAYCLSSDRRINGKRFAQIAQGAQWKLSEPVYRLTEAAHGTYSVLYLGPLARASSTGPLKLRHFMVRPRIRVERGNPLNHRLGTSHSEPRVVDGQDCNHHSETNDLEWMTKTVSVLEDCRWQIQYSEYFVGSINSVVSDIYRV